MFVDLEITVIICFVEQMIKTRIYTYEAFFFIHLNNKHHTVQYIEHKALFQVQIKIARQLLFVSLRDIHNIVAIVE